MEFTPQLIQMFSPEGFIELFYQTLNENPEYTHRQAFDKLNDEYYAVFGKYRYTFASFKVIKDRKK